MNNPYGVTGSAQAVSPVSSVGKRGRQPTTQLAGMGGSLPPRMPLQSVDMYNQGRRNAYAYDGMSGNPAMGQGTDMQYLRLMDPSFQDRQMRKQTGVRPGMIGAEGAPPMNAVQAARAQGGMPPSGLGGSLDPKYAALNAYLMNRG